MNEAVNNTENVKNSKGRNRTLILAAIIIIIIMVGAFFGVYRVVNNIIIQANIDNMAELAQHDRNAISLSIENKQKLLYDWTNTIRAEHPSSLTELAKSLSISKDILGADKVYFIDDEFLYIADSGVIAKDQPYDEDLKNMNGDYDILRYDTTGFGGTAETKKEYIVVMVKTREFTVEGHKITYALAELNLRTFQNELTIESYDGMGTSNVIDMDGLYIVANNLTSLQKRQNLFDNMKESGATVEGYASIDEYQNAVLNNGSLSVQVNMDGTDYIFVSSLVNGVDWIFLTICPRSVFDSMTNRITALFLALAAVVILSVSVVLFLMMRSRAQQQRIIAEQAHHIELTNALVLAEQSSRSKTTFLNNMSHDIRTPMNAITGFTNLAIQHLHEPDLLKDYLSKISVSSAHLLSLINDILDMSRIESGKVEINEKVESLSNMLEAVEDIFQVDSSKKNQTLEFIKDIRHDVVVCDRLRVSQVLINLVSNAVKYTPENGHISVTMTEKEDVDPDKATYEFTVKDDGVGMSEEFAKTIFEPFTREQTSTISGIQGTGLGMAITKNVIDMMKGDISLKTKQGEGSEFTVTLSFKTADESELATDTIDSEKEKMDFSGKRILLVDDNEMNREIACEILMEVDFEVEMAVDGKDACDKLAASEPGYYDLILMDIQMPVMDGYEAAKYIRAMDNKELANIPIVALSANAFEEDKALSLAAGMNDHIAKPIDIAALFNALHKIFSKGN
ncbi:MAG: ATP-binding protein [Erysipelotrichaceae bacterium]|nr:ATP-binding protein [Erysipelotrichaceae bacterium]